MDLLLFFSDEIFVLVPGILFILAYFLYEKHYWIDAILKIAFWDLKIWGIKRTPEALKGRALGLGILIITVSLIMFISKCRSM